MVRESLRRIISLASLVLMLAPVAEAAEDAMLVVRNVAAPGEPEVRLIWKDVAWMARAA